MAVENRSWQRRGLKHPKCELVDVTNTRRFEHVLRSLSEGHKNDVEQETQLTKQTAGTWLWEPGNITHANAERGDRVAPADLICMLAHLGRH